MTQEQRVGWMEYDLDKVDEITLAPLWLTSFKNADGVRARKDQDRQNDGSTLLKGHLSDPKSEAKFRSWKDWRQSDRNSENRRYRAR
jgi:hypothetical protein